MKIVVLPLNMQFSFLTKKFLVRNSKGDKFACMLVRVSEKAIAQPAIPLALQEILVEDSAWKRWSANKSAAGTA